LQDYSLPGHENHFANHFHRQAHQEKRVGPTLSASPTNSGKFFALPLPLTVTAGCRGIRFFTVASRNPARPPENPRGWRIAKEKASKKIDAIVALAMACVAAMAHRGEMGSRSARRFNRSLHVSAQRLTADRGPVYVGQTLVDVPSTVIAQQSTDGALHVLAAFASEGMGLRRHVETVVKPWFVTNARFALQDNRLLLGVAEDDLDEQTKWDLLEIVEDALGGFWEKSESKWEARRDAVLELIGKATPGAFRPALQIDPSAKILIEALSGRWTYESERRERRTIWYHVANAFSLLV
jgi:hypothetical protein